ncbi:hypothetical protein M2132_000791 [Dysgonomonas sp. PH5-45]|uniref:CD225/dispanin family protein n=1 Tax=unclassified Dysgonomonas TaxID=2630389 RepID=UPI002473C521|nr:MULTISPECIES: CD225/dispanin family protein [unclassified Dysgonomonas]MDH6354463.1 hypothetical protein [Dysgonomonas sp. PH5-45]MDH6387362.1 hypothetical protein [Dysgonomonas sp. PH5-37]
MENENTYQQNSYQQDPYNNVPVTPPNNNMPLAIVSLILGCCSPWCTGLILGIIAVIFASQVKTKFNAGDPIGAEKSAKTAKILSFIALGLFVVGIIMSIVTIVSMGGIDGVKEYYESELAKYS